MTPTEAAKFISKMNSKAEDFIAYCGTSEEEIHSSINDFQLPFEASFSSISDETRLKALLGADVDPVNKSVELWGPFIDDEKWDDLANLLWSDLQSKLISPHLEINIFCGIKNQNCRNFALSHGFELRNEHLILKATKEMVGCKPGATTSELPKALYEDFLDLHSICFPSTYLSGSEILESVDNHQKVFVIVEDSHLLGYIYVTVDTENSESSIEFFGVTEDARGRGIGLQLLLGALHWIFEFEKICEVTLCVDNDNSTANYLYKKVGFQEIHQCVHFVKKGRNP